MTAACETMHLLLQAELDGELDAAGAAGLSSHLYTCPDCTELQSELGTLSTRLRTGLTRYPAPAALLASLQLPAPAPPPPRRSARNPRNPWTHAASFGAGLALAASVMLAIRPTPAEPGALSDLVTAHIRALQPGHLLDVPSTDSHTVKPWFDGRVPFAPVVNDLAAKGFPLLGGRLDSLSGPPVATLVYGRRLHMIDVFVAPGDRPHPIAALQGYNTIGWTQGGLVYQAVSDLNAAELATFAQLMQAPP